MKKSNVFRRSFWYWGIIWAVLFSLTGVVFGYGSHEGAAAVFTADSKSRQDGSSTLPPTNNNTELEGSPVIGGGVRTPPDIGAAGTASSTPPVRTESPTDEPAILPDVSPVPKQPSDTERSPDATGQPFGQPDHYKKKQE